VSRAARVGDRLGDRYELEARIGEGGSGEVWRARHDGLGTHVAIKFLKLDARRDRDTFRREARIVASLRHRNVVDVFDFDDEATNPYLVMELLESPRLSDAIESGDLDLADRVAVACQVLGALGRAHEAGLVHRDVKPENVFVERTEDDTVHVKLVDFGSCRRDVSREPGALRSVLPTEEKLVVGTPEYMAPEQVRAEHDIDPRADLWAVGVLLHEMLLGASPFESRDSTTSLLAVLHRPVTIRRHLQAELHPLAAVVERALNRDRDARYADAEEMRTAILVAAREVAAARALAGGADVRLERLLAARTPAPVARASHVRVARRRPQPDDGVDGPPTVDEPLEAQLTPPPKRRPSGSRTLAALSLIVALAALVVSLLRERRPANGEEATPPSADERAAPRAEAPDEAGASEAPDEARSEADEGSANVATAPSSPAAAASVAGPSEGPSEAPNEATRDARSPGGRAASGRSAGRLAPSARMTTSGSSAFRDPGF